MVLNFIDEQIETVLQGCDYNDIEKESFGRTAGKKVNQLFIGNHVIDAQRNVRTIPHKQMFGRETAVARCLTDPENKVYFLTMEEGLYEVDVHSLQAREIYTDGNRPRKPEDDVLPGYHGKGGYMTQERLVYANNGEGSDAARHDPTVPSGCLAEWLGEDKGWRVIKRAQFTETTGPDGIYGGETGQEGAVTDSERTETGPEGTETDPEPSAGETSLRIEIGTEEIALLADGPIHVTARAAAAAWASSPAPTTP